MQCKLTNGVHDLYWIGGTTWLANTSLVLCSDAEDVFLVLHNISKRCTAVRSLGHHGCFPLHRCPVALLNDVVGDFRSSIRERRFPGYGGTIPVNISNGNVLGCIGNI